MTITVFTRPACVQCNATKLKLEKHGLDFTLVDVSLPENESALQRVKDLGYMTAPVVELSNGEHWGGYRPDKIMELVS